MDKGGMIPAGQTLHRASVEQLLRPSVRLAPVRPDGTPLAPHDTRSDEPGLQGRSPRYGLSLVAFIYMMYDKMNNQSNGC